MTGEPYQRLERGSHGVRVAIAVAALAAATLFPVGSDAERLTFVRLVGLVYLPYAVGLLFLSRRSQGPAVRMASVVGDVLIIFLFQLLVPHTYVVALFGYLLVVAFYSYVGGLGAGLAVGVAAIALSVLVPSTTRTVSAVDAYTLLMYAFVLFSLALLLDRASRAQRSALETLRGEVAERKRAQRELILKAEELERSNRDLEQFAYVASHDLKEPLRAVTSSLEVVARRHGCDLDARTREFIELAVDGADRMKALIDGLLSYARLSTGPAQRAPMPAHIALEEACQNLRSTLEEAGAEVVWPALPTLEVVPIQITQLFQNLIANAIKFRGPEPPRVEIRVRPAGGFWSFTVSDNGIGMDPREGERAFELFRRLHDPDAYPGSGIGLATCQKIVERHGGRIWVESSPGAGSHFHFTLPGARGGRSATGATDGRSRSAGEGPGPGPGTLHILLVEDSRADAALAEVVLADVGSVERCTTLDDALARLTDPAQPAPSLVLLDLSLPDAQGLDGLDRLACASFPPVVVMSGDNDPSRTRAALERGARAYVVKGETPASELRRVVREAAATRI